MLNFTEKFQNDKKFYSVQTTCNKSVGVVEKQEDGNWWLYLHFPYSVRINHECMVEICAKLDELNADKMEVMENERQQR